MLGVVGDLVTDVVVRLTGLDSNTNTLDSGIRHATDTDAEVIHRQGGSAANLAVAAKKLGAEVAFFGNVGIDERGNDLVRELEIQGVKTCVSRSGGTGTVVALLDINGERSMLTDRAASKDFADYPAEWLTDISFLHIPAYSLVVEPLGSTSISMAKQVERVSVGISSVGAVEDFGVEKFWDLVKQVDPALIVCNKAEAELLGYERLEDMGIEAVVTAGAFPTEIFSKNSKSGKMDLQLRSEISPVNIGKVKDTTGAGDAFTAGLLVGLTSGKASENLLEDSVRLGHKVAADLLKSRE